MSTVQYRLLRESEGYHIWECGTTSCIKFILDSKFNLASGILVSWACGPFTLLMASKFWSKTITKTSEVAQYRSVMPLHMELRSAPCLFLWVISLALVSCEFKGTTSSTFNFKYTTEFFQWHSASEFSNSVSDVQLLPSTRCLLAWIRPGSCRVGRQVVVTRVENRGRASLVLAHPSPQCELHYFSTVLCFKV
jgi:hypothetical protein